MGTHEGRLPAVAVPDATALLRVPGAEKRFCVGEYLLRQGEPADHVLLLRTGLVKVLSVSPAGGQTILALRGPGQLLGELGSIDGAPRSAAVIALEPVVAHSVSVERFRTFLRTEPEAAFGLLCTLVERLRSSDRQRLEFGSMTVPQRLAGLLLDLARPVPGPGGPSSALRVTLSQKELAEAVGASLEACAKAMRTLREAGVVDTARRSVVVRDVPGLVRLARDGTFPG
jgi:CRP-like cAMP-binding protein